MNLRWLAWFTALLPIAAVHLAYLLSINAGDVPACVPYWEGCTSISRAGRFGLANHLFKALMLPYATLLMLFWGLCWLWLRELRHDAPRRSVTILALGLVAALFLILYVTFLGVEGPIYQWLRRYGITVHFSFSVLAQMLVCALLTPVTRLSIALRRTMLVFAGLLLVLGLASIPLQHLVDDRDRAVNALEWTYTLLMGLFYGLIGTAWGQTRFRVDVHSG